MASMGRLRVTEWRSARTGRPRVSRDQLAIPAHSANPAAARPAKFEARAKTGIEEFRAPPGRSAAQRNAGINLSGVDLGAARTSHDRKDPGHTSRMLGEFVRKPPNRFKTAARTLTRLNVVVERRPSPARGRIEHEGWRLELVRLPGRERKWLFLDRQEPCPVAVDRRDPLSAVSSRPGFRRHSPAPSRASARVGLGRLGVGRKGAGSRHPAGPSSVVRGAAREGASRHPKPALAGSVHHPTSSREQRPYGASPPSASQPADELSAFA